MKIKEKLMHKYALSPQGASDMLKAFVSVTVSDLVLMIPVSLLYFIVKDYMEGTLQGKGGFYIAGIIVTLALIAITTYIQYNATFLSTYVESGVRRITLAEKLRKIPLSFFGKKDLSDLTSTIMADCAQMETASSHFIPDWWEHAFLQQSLQWECPFSTGEWHWQLFGCFRFHFLL